MTGLSLNLIQYLLIHTFVIKNDINPDYFDESILSFCYVNKVAVLMYQFLSSVFPLIVWFLINTIIV